MNLKQIVKNYNFTGNKLFTDGSCIMPEGKGGYSFVLETKEKIYICAISEEKKTTCNRMELTPIIKGLLFFSKIVQNSTIDIYSDSQYVINGMKEWIKDWKRKNFKDIKNVDLWVELENLKTNCGLECSWHWNPRRSSPQFDQVDDLANQAASEVQIFSEKSFNEVDYLDYVYINPASTPLF